MKKIKRKIKAQISTEMIIILAVLLALVLIVATKLQETAKKGTEQIASEEQSIFATINQTTGIAKKGSGEICVSDNECASGTCLAGYCT